MQQPVVNALTRVVDPEVALSIVDVGSLICGVTIEAELCWQPAWTPDKPSVRAKRFMQW